MQRKLRPLFTVCVVCVICVAAAYAMGASPWQALATFAPLWLIVATLSFAIDFFAQKDVRWAHQFVAWLKDASPGQLAFSRSAYFIGIGILGAIVNIPVREFHLAVPGLFGNPLGWIVWGIMMAIGMSVSGLFFKPYQPPEDWLLWESHTKV